MQHDVEITVTEDGATRVVALAGEVDLRCAGRLGVALNAAVRGGTGPVVVDLSELRFIDSSGLALLVNVARRLDHAGRGFAVVAPPGSPRRAIELARLDRALVVLGDRSAALAAVGPLAA
jgi:anti-sigma B factor antagonist